MARNTFKKSYFGTPVYACRICTRNTRDTNDNGSVELCPECFEWSSLENGLSDDNLYGTPEGDKMEAQIAELKQAAVDKGGVIAGFTRTAKQA